MQLSTSMLLISEGHPPLFYMLLPSLSSEFYTDINAYKIQNSQMSLLSNNHENRNNYHY